MSLRRILAPAVFGALLMGCELGALPRVDTTAMPPASGSAAPPIARPDRSPAVTPRPSLPTAPAPIKPFARIDAFAVPFSYPTSVGEWRPTPVTVSRNIVEFSGNVRVVSPELPWVDGCEGMERTRIRRLEDVFRVTSICTARCMG